MKAQPKAHPGATHRLNNPVAVAELSALARGVLGAPVGVEHHPGHVTSADTDRFDEGVTDQHRTHVVRHRQAQDAPRRQVLDEPEIQEPFPR